MNTEKKRAFIIDILFVVAVVAVVWLCLRYLLNWLLPFVIAFVIAYISQRPIRFLARHTRVSNRVVSVIFVLLIIGAALFALVFLIYRVMLELSTFFNQIPAWLQNGVTMLHFYLTDATEGLASFFPEEVSEQLAALLVNLSNSMVGEIGSISSKAVTWLASKAAGIPNILVTFVITIVACFYICLDFENIASFIRTQVPERYRALASNAKATLINGILHMGKAYLILMTITFVELAIGLTILRVDYSITIAALVAVVDILPVLGTGTVLIPWVLISVIQGQYGMAIGLGVIYVVITIMRNILEPRLVGQQLGLNPVVTLIMMYVGLKILGLPGMFLFPIVMIILKASQDAGLIKIWKDPS